MASSPPSQNTLKRKASSELPAKPLRTINSEDPVLQQLLQTEAKKYDDDYAETVRAMRDMVGGSPSENAGMQQVISSLKARPELAKMEESKSLLQQSGLDIEVGVRNGKEFTVVKFQGGVL